MAIPFLNNINLSDNELQNAKLHITGTAPTAAAGQIYFNSTDSVARYHNGTTWVDVTRKISVSGTPLAYSQAIDLVAGTNVGIAEASGVITISSTDQFQGTVTSVSSSTAGDALDVTVTNATTTPDLAFTWAGTAAEYIDGTGALTTFPTIPNDTTYDLDSIQVGNDVAITLVGSDATTDTLTLVAGTNVTLTDDGSNNITIDSTDQFTGTLTGVTEGPGITVTPSATSPTVAVDYLGADNYLLEAGVATVADSDDIINFSDDTDSNVKKTTLGTMPVTALTEVKTYIDNAVAGGLIYQGGFDGSTGLVDGTSDYLDSRGTQIAVNKGWTYTVTVAGTFYGEVVEVGDVLIAEDNLASGTGALSDWTTVQNNVDLASLTQVGIGNVVPATNAPLKGLSVTYASGTATAGLDIAGLTTQAPANNALAFIPFYDQTAGSNLKVGLSTLAGDLNEFTSFSGTIGNGASTSLTVNSATHGLGTDSTSFMVQLVEVSSGETVYADVTRGASGLVTIDFATAPALNAIRVLIQKIG